MAGHILVLLFCQTVLTWRLSWAAVDSPSVRIDHLVQMDWNLTVGLFATDQELVESYLKRRFEDEQYGYKLSMAESQTSRYPDMPGMHEVLVIHGIYDAQGATSRVEVSDNIATKFEFVFMGIPDLRSVGSSQSISLMVQMFTNSPRPIYFPFFTDQVTYVDELSSYEDGTILLRKDDDELILHRNGTAVCVQDPDEKEDDFRALRDSLWVTYPHPFTFDWSICDHIFDPNLCQVLNSMTSRSGNGRDVCVSFHTIDSPRRCGASMTITKMTGKFREASLLNGPTPMMSFEGESVEMPGHFHGLVSPCL